MKSYTLGFERLHIELDKLNSTGYTTCPSCSESRKQSNKNKKVLKVYTKTGYYDCKHCDFKGRVDSDEWIEEQHAKETGLTPAYANPKPITKPKQEKPVEQIKPFHTNPLTTKAIEFFKGRGISKETAEACGVAYNKGAICFNYYKGGEIVGAKYRLIDQKRMWQHVTPEKYLYGLNDIEGQDTIIIVEGEFDKLAFYECGIKNCVSVAQGAPNEGQEVGTKLQCLDNSIDYIKDVKRVILACDNDPNGRYLTKVLIERFGANRCSVVEFPEGSKDANDVLLNHGEAFLADLVDQASEVPIDGVRTLRQVESEMWDTYRNGYRKGVSTGIRSLDGHFSYYKPWWNLSYGIPNSGKSEFELFKMMCMSVLHGWKWACFVPEAYPAGDFYNDCISKLTGRGVDVDSRNRLSEDEYKIAMDFVNEHFFFIYPQDDKDATGKQLANNFTNVIDKIKELKLAKGIDGFLIDPINQLSASSEFGGTKDERLEQMYGEIDIVCKTHFLSGNLVAHPRTLYKDKDQEDYRAPTPYEIAGGAMNYNKAYCIMCVHRPFNQSNKISTLVQIDVQKVKKHKVAGTPALIDLNFDKKTGWYLNLDGSCALDNAFHNMCAGENIDTQETTFSDKLKADGLDPWGEKLPF